MTLQPPSALAGLPEPAAAWLRGIAAAPRILGGYPGLDLLPPDAGVARPQADSIVAELAARYRGALDDRSQAGARLQALRAELARQGLTGFIVPLTDEYQSEYVPLRAKRLTWLCGFSGSAGMAIVLTERAAVWSDGRYTLQLAAQVDGALFERRHLIDEPPADWLQAALKPGNRVAYDPWLHTEDGVKRLAAACTAAGAELVATDNLIDMVWSDQPPPPLGPVRVHDTVLAGRSSAEKRAEIAAAVRAKGADAVALTLPESIAWLLNIRGSDVQHTPLPLSMALLAADGAVDLYIDARKLTADVRAHLGDVRLHDPAAFPAALDALGQAGRRVQVDAATTGAYVLQRLAAAGATLVRADDPCLLPKACKTAAELDGTRAAHRRDGAAVAKFLAWLDAEVAAGNPVDELGAAERLQAFRRLSNDLRDLSFSTISGGGPNGAIVHYRVTAETNRPLGRDTLYLVDSGGQYPDGTTDITRTVALGTPSAEMRERFTRVLKGHIALATAKFPEGTSGMQLDALARRALWDIGLDYDHGTGHGVGSYLSVHEGPQRIAKLGSPVPLKPGMIVSNEPGYYKTGAYGIRIENLVAVRVETEAAENGRRWLGFETLTRAPIDRRLVDLPLLTPAEVGWLDAYHALVWQEIAPLVDDATRAWLKQATAPLGA